MQMHKKAQTSGLITGLIFSIASLVIGVIIALVITSTVSNAGLITASTVEAGAVGNLTGNFSSGITNIAGKIPTVLLVAMIVLIIGVLAVLVGVWSRMRMGGSGL